MIARRFARTLGFVLGTLALTLSAGTALAASPDPTLAPAWPLDAALTYHWTSGAVPPVAMQSAVNGAAAAATSSRRSHAPSFAYSSAAANAISYGTTNPCGVNGLACFSRNPTGGYWHLWFRENGHRYDWGALSWCEMTGSPYGCYNALTITLDELGHVGGLDHHVNLADGSDYADAVVQAYSHARAQVGWNASSFGRCDVAALQQVYDVANWTTLYSTCLDVPTVLSLGASASSVPSGSTVTLTATLKSNGTGRLLGNPMAGRAVVLQTWSGSAWTDFTTMAGASTAGTYRATFSPRATVQFRAVFRKPSGEGVRASTSGTVTVTTTCTTAPCPAVAGSAR